MMANYQNGPLDFFVTHLFAVNDLPKQYSDSNNY